MLDFIVPIGLRNSIMPFHLLCISDLTKTMDYITAKSARLPLFHRVYNISVQTLIMKCYVINISLTVGVHCTVGWLKIRMVTNGSSRTVPVYPQIVLFVFSEGMYPFFVIKLRQTSLWLGYMLQLSLRLLLSEEGWSWWGDWLMYQVIDDEDTP